MKSAMKWFVLAVLISPAMAQQPQISAKFDMPWSSTLLTTARLDALRGPSTTGVWSAISKQTAALNLNVDLVKLSTTGSIPITVTFPGQTTTWTVTALRLTVCSTGTYVCEQPMKLRQALDKPYTVRAGHPLVIGLILVPSSKGDLAMAEDALTTAGPITPAPAPVLVPSPAPAPTPGTPSAAGACITPTGAPTTAGAGCATPLASLVDSTGGTWTLNATQALRDTVNTQPALNNFGYWPLSYIYIRAGGVLCGFNPNHGDICWTAGKWQ